MKKTIAILFAFVSLNAFAQTIKDDFETNRMGWNEIVAKKGEAVIKEGVLHLSAGAGLTEGRSFMSTCYLPVDLTKDFTIKAKCIDTKINDDERGIGLVINYMDDYNYDEFLITKGTALYRRWVEGELVGFRQSQVKVDNKSKNHEIVVKSTLQKLEFIVDNMTVLEIRYAPVKYSGFGIAVWAIDGKQEADIDEVEIIQ